MVSSNSKSKNTNEFHKDNTRNYISHSQRRNLRRKAYAIRLLENILKNSEHYINYKNEKNKNLSLNEELRILANLAKNVDCSDVVISKNILKHVPIMNNIFKSGNSNQSKASSEDQNRDVKRNLKTSNAKPMIYKEGNWIVTKVSNTKKRRISKRGISKLDRNWTVVKFDWTKNSKDKADNDELALQIKSHNRAIDDDVIVSDSTHDSKDLIENLSMIYQTTDEDNEDSALLKKGKPTILDSSLVSDKEINTDVEVEITDSPVSSSTRKLNSSPDIEHEETLSDKDVTFNQTIKRPIDSINKNKEISESLEVKSQDVNNELLNSLVLENDCEEIEVISLSDDSISCESSIDDVIADSCAEEVEKLPEKMQIDMQNVISSSSFPDQEIGSPGNKSSDKENIDDDTLQDDLEVVQSNIGETNKVTILPTNDTINVTRIEKSPGEGPISLALVESPRKRRKSLQDLNLNVRSNQVVSPVLKLSPQKAQKVLLGSEIFISPEVSEDEVDFVLNSEKQDMHNNTEILLSEGLKSLKDDSWLKKKSPQKLAQEEQLDSISPAVNCIIDDDLSSPRKKYVHTASTSPMKHKIKVEDIMHEATSDSESENNFDGLSETCTPKDLQPLKKSPLLNSKTPLLPAISNCDNVQPIGALMLDNSNENSVINSPLCNDVDLLSDNNETNDQISTKKAGNILEESFITMSPTSPLRKTSGIAPKTTSLRSIEADTSSQILSQDNNTNGDVILLQMTSPEIQLEVESAPNSPFKNSLGGSLPNQDTSPKVGTWETPSQFSTPVTIQETITAKLSSTENSTPLSNSKLKSPCQTLAKKSPLKTPIQQKIVDLSAEGVKLADKLPEVGTSISNSPDLLSIQKTPEQVIPVSCIEIQKTPLNVTPAILAQISPIAEVDDEEERPSSSSSTSGSDTSKSSSVALVLKRLSVKPDELEEIINSPRRSRRVSLSAIQNNSALLSSPRLTRGGSKTPTKPSTPRRESIGGAIGTTPSRKRRLSTIAESTPTEEKTVSTRSLRPRTTPVKYKM